MRRAQSVRHHPRPSIALGADDLGILREGDESNEDVLRRQLIEKDRENDKLKSQILTLQEQLQQRPPIEELLELKKETKNLELILHGTMRENERSMAELQRAKDRERMLERELAKLAGENWQMSLDIPPATAMVIGARSPLLHQRSNTMPIVSPRMTDSSTSAVANVPTAVEPNEALIEQQRATLAHLEQVRMLILGMEQRLQTREEKLALTVEKAEGEERRFEELRRGVLADAAA